MTEAALTLDEINRLTGGRIGTSDVPCPTCGPDRRSPVNRHRRVLRIWRIDSGFASFHCARCGEKGYVRDTSTRRRPPDPTALARARAEANERERMAAATQLRKARWLWSLRKPLAGGIGEVYLRNRAYRGPLPATLAFLPANGEYPPALIAGFGLADEIEPGLVAIRDSAIRGVHLTRLLPDGSDRERGDGAKIMLGRSAGCPIVLALPNDLLGLTITEGVEDGLSAHSATGLGAWAAGCASRMPALADAIPRYINALTIYSHDDQAGRRGAVGLAERLHARGIEVFVDSMLL